MSDSLTSRNLAALEARFPPLAEALARLAEPASKRVGSLETGDLNLDLGHRLLYPIDAASAAEAEVAAYLARPNRFYMDPPERYPAPHQQQYFVSEALHRHFAGRELAPRPPNPVPEGGFLVVYGIGLGLHLPRLLAELPVQHIVLVEEHLEFLRHSLDVVDWAGLLETLAERGRTLHFIFGTDPPVVAARVHWYMRGAGFGLLDGSYLYRHYQSTLLDQAYADFLQKLPLLPISIGYFEDEMDMISNCTVNLIRERFLYMDQSPRLEKDTPALIIGSGPSLDRMIDEVRRLAPQAVIFSCGTALQPLLRAGIRPDFHCELENARGSVEHIERVARDHSLAGITLLASTTVDPSMHCLFQERVLYFRDSVSSTPLWCPDRTGIHGTAPTCTNLALRACMILAFRELYLFGVDLGTRDPRDHHAKDAFYFERPDWLVSQNVDPIRAMTIELPGNLGGKAYTNTILHWARMMMAQTIETFSFARIHNCSDGVSIPGARPKLASSVRIALPPGRKAVTLARLHRELTPKAAGEMAPMEHLQAARRAFVLHYREMQDEIARSLAADDGFVPFYRRLERLLAPTGPNPFQKLLRAVNIGMVMMCFQMGYYFYRRAEPAEQPVVMRVFLEALSERLAVMADRLDDLFRRLEEVRLAHP